ncbi:RagB/SusD family nutrient uptake outer membrane protein [Nostoc ellipsosporum NOK]|nr:RagB/SusD family nutrient uptake outer membrane protein [Nostoc ellipsosporum NOK]
MKKSSIYILILSTLMIATGCRKYVDIKTQGNLIPKETVNYRYLLNNENTFASSAGVLDIPSDDIYIADAAQMNDLSSSSFYQFYVRYYTWQSAIYTLNGESDPDWDYLYKIIYNANVVISEVGASTGGTEAEKNQLMAEAKVHRADAYLTLVNMYAKPYGASAATDPGVPLILSPTVDATLSRNPVAQVYQQIIDDLTSSYPFLPVRNTHNTLPSRAAAFAILARVNLYKGDFAKAGIWADSSLNIQNTLNDLGSLTTTTYPRQLLNPEVILVKKARLSLGYSPSAFRLSDSLLNLLGTNDRRYALFTAAASNVSATYTGRYYFRERIGNFETRNYGPTVPEMMLIKAESLARSGNTTDAITLVNNLRAKRFTTATYVPVTAANAQQALIEVIKERQRELFCAGLRWFDQRRMKDDPLFARTHTRVFLGNNYTLASNSNRYVFPIADFYRSFNPGITPNP